jgi:protein-S-isoprenylcysteine O-methyltransferase Ste14
MKLRLLAAFALLPVPVAMVVPAVLLFAFRESRWAHSWPAASDPLCWAGAAAGALGVLLTAWSGSAFKRFGDGTPAPWDPPREFVAYGPYRYVRNPMILGVAFVLLAEALIFRSRPLGGWFLLFVVGNMVYMPLFEEKGLARRFGETYLRYKENVPRWLPRVKPWSPEEGNA